MTAPVDLLAIAAHPDDAEIACGGALLIAKAANRRTAIADLTDAEMSTAGTPERRSQERMRASELLGLAERVGLGLPDTMLGSHPAHRDALVALLRELRPIVVLAPEIDDRHPDHAATGRLVRDACFYAGVGKLGKGEPYRPLRLYHYPLHHPCQPSFVLDVSAVWEQRTRAIDAYASQFARDRETTGEAPATEINTGSFRELLCSRARVYGAMVGVARGEPYRSLGPLAAHEVPGLTAARPQTVGPYRTYL